MNTNGKSLSTGETDKQPQSKPFVNKFLNDGSFLETFKKMQQQQQQKPKLQQPTNLLDKLDSKQSTMVINNQQDKQSKSLIEKVEDVNSKADNINSSPADSKIRISSSPTKVLLGKRRNQKLKVGIIKRDRKETDSESQDNLDAWTKYMKEVRQYKEKYGDDSDKKRPLVK